MSEENRDNDHQEKTILINTNNPIIQAAAIQAAATLVTNCWGCTLNGHEEWARQVGCITRWVLVSLEPQNPPWKAE